MVSFADKKKMLGSMRSAIGGETVGNDGPKRKRAESDLEPFSYFSSVEAIPSELVHTFQSKVVLDGTPSPEFAMTCLKSSTPYLGVCYSEMHAKELESHLAHKVFTSMLDRFSFVGMAPRTR